MLPHQCGEMRCLWNSGRKRVGLHHVPGVLKDGDKHWNESFQMF